MLQAKASFVPFLHQCAQFLLFLLFYKQYREKLSFFHFCINLRSFCCLENYILQARASFIPFLHQCAQFLLFILYYKQYTQKLSFSYFCINLSSFCLLKNMYSSRSFISPFPHQFTQFLLLGKLYITSKSFICSLPAPMCVVSAVSFVLQAIHGDA
jgi:hypothetical protein